MQPRPRTTLEPIAGSSPPRFLVHHDDAWRHGDFSPLELVDGSPRGPPPSRKVPLPAAPMLKPPPPLFRKGWIPPAVEHVRSIQEHNMETADPGQSPWWQHPAAFVTGAPPSRRIFKRPSPPAAALAPLASRAQDARYALATQRTSTGFLLEMERVRMKLSSAQEARARVPTGVSMLMSGAAC